MSQSDQKHSLNQQQKNNMLDELESLSKMLDEDDWDEPMTDPRPVPEDIPVLKSFVDSVPTLSNENDEATLQPPSLTDTLDTEAGNFNTIPVGRGDKLDMSFLDQDPLEISDRVRQHSTQKTAKTETEASSNHSSSPSKPLPTQTHIHTQPAEPAPLPQKPITQTTQESTPVKTAHNPAPPSQTITQAASQLKQAIGNENPFLSRATLNKIKENRAWTPENKNASTELHKLLEDNPLQKLSFDASPSSKEYQALRRKASQLINDVIRSNLPRMEAELRMKLEQEVDHMFKDVQKKSRK